MHIPSQGGSFCCREGRRNLASYFASCRECSCITPADGKPNVPATSDKNNDADKRLEDAASAVSCHRRHLQRGRRLAASGAISGAVSAGELGRCHLRAVLSFSWASLVKESPLPGMFWHCQGTGRGWLLLERELLSLQPGRWKESSPGACSCLGHPLLATKELRIAQSFPWCPLVISVYGL